MLYYKYFLYMKKSIQRYSLSLNACIPPYERGKTPKSGCVDPLPCIAFGESYELLFKGDGCISF